MRHPRDHADAEGVIQQPDVSINYRVAGPEEGDAFVLIHGWCCEGSDWAPVVARLASTARVIVPDLRGHGTSTASAKGYGPDLMAVDVIKVLDQLRVDQAVLIGHSAGAEVAASVAVDYPERVRAVVAVEPAYGTPVEMHDAMVDISRRLRGPDAREVVAEYFARIDDNPAAKTELKQAHLRSALSCRADVASQMFDAFTFGPTNAHFQHDAKQFLARRSSPLLAFYRNSQRASIGEDFVIRSDDVVLTYSDCGHWLHQEQPDRFVADVLTWLGRLTPQTVRQP